MKTINLEELVLLTHPGELRAIRDAKGSVYVPGWKTPKPAAVACQWKLETICKFIEQKRLYFYPVTEEHKALARSVAVIQAPAGNPDIVIEGPEPHPEIVPALDKLPDEWHVDNYDKSREWYLSVTGRDGEFYGKSKFIRQSPEYDSETNNIANCFGGDYCPSKYGFKLSREDFERFVYNPWKESQQATEARKSCSHSCGPGDYWEGGKCARMGCYEPQPTPLSPEQAEAVRTLNTLRRAWYQRNNPGDDQTTTPLEWLILIIAALSMSALFIAFCIGGAQ